MGEVIECSTWNIAWYKPHPDRDRVDTMEAERITRAELRLVEQALEHEGKERRQEMRRASDRVDALELRQNRSERLLVGESGTNGVVGMTRDHHARLDWLERNDRNRERLAWLLLAAAVGVITYLLRG